MSEEDPNDGFYDEEWEREKFDVDIKPPAYMMDYSVKQLLRRK